MIPDSPIQRLDNNLTLLQGVVEGLPDGIMILSDRGELTYDNSCARQICQNLLSASASEHVPHQVWRCCQALMDSRRQFEQTIVIEDEIQTEEGTTIRIRVRWLNPQVEHPAFLVTLEDQQQSAQYRAYAEAQRYSLTERETEVWVLKRIGLTYKAIAAKLYIAEDTVKKHIKNIHARRDASQWANI
ncbi:MAG: helix-turn-helix transcriptional regulator [Oscillatoriophycideae cyanobacterium NC_groundwater_1537_Pr4_S-0.65um_50_18]|nr:helix-turn-helix transcriptional regulator [Oscillatoriophycideae cyanobacterium NC_groundwater_1537_Pr4_S-0.65um_50_18]